MDESYKPGKCQASSSFASCPRNHLTLLTQGPFICRDFHPTGFPKGTWRCAPSQVPPPQPSNCKAFRDSESLLLCLALLLIRAPMPINAQGARRYSYPIANIPMCMTNQGFKHSIERSYSESIFIIVEYYIIRFLSYMSWIKDKQGPMCYLYQKIPDLWQAHIIHGWTE